MLDAIDAYHVLIERSLATAGISDKMMHVHVGLAIYIGSQLILRTRRGSIDAWLVVVLAEALNEALDRLYWGDWRWGDTLGDVASTLIWPTMLLLSTRYRRARFARRQAAAAASMTVSMPPPFAMHDAAAFELGRR